MTSLEAAERGIRLLHARYMDAVWRKDFAAFGDCFVENAEWRIGGRTHKGRAEIVAAFETISTHFHRILLTFRTPILELTPEGASARTYVDERTARKNGGPSSAIGLYFERFVEQGERWQFKWRLWQTLYRGSADLDGVFFDNADYGPPPAMPPLDEPAPDYPGFPGRD